MKTKKTSKQSQKSKEIFGIKNVKVKLNRLSQSTIQKYLENSNDRNCDLYLNIKDGKVVKIKEAGLKIAMTITVNSIIPKPPENNSYSLRAKKNPKEDEKKPAKAKCTTVAVLGNSTRKNQLWSMSKKSQKKSMLTVGAVVFGKQVSTISLICYQHAQSYHSSFEFSFRRGTHHGRVKYWISTNIKLQQLSSIMDIHITSGKLKLTSLYKWTKTQRMQLEI